MMGTGGGRRREDVGIWGCRDGRGAGMGGTADGREMLHVEIGSMKGEGCWESGRG